MSAIFAKLTDMILPILLNWAYNRINSYGKKLKEKAEREKERGVVNEKTIEKLNACETKAECIAAARDVLNGKLSAPEASGR